MMLLLSECVVISVIYSLEMLYLPHVLYGLHMQKRQSASAANQLLLKNDSYCENMSN